MINVILDTNVYRKNPDLSDLNFKALERLAIRGKVKVHIPYIVEREFQTQQREFCSISINKINSGLKDLLRRPLSEETYKKIENLKQKIISESEEILSDSDNQIVKWANKISANREPLCLEQATKSMEAYFQGMPPLKEIKIRSDIPDSFLVRSIEKIYSEIKPIYVIAGDKKVRDSFSTVSDIKTYKELSDFIESEVVQTKITELDELQNQQDIIKALILNEDNSHEIEQVISNEIGELLVGETVEDSSIPDDNNEATIEGYYDAKDIEVLIGEAFYYGDNQYGIPFTLNIKVSTTFYIFKSDIYSIEGSETLSISDHNRHYFEAEKEYVLTVLGVVSVTIEQDDLNLSDISENILEIELSSIDEIKLLNSDNE